MDMNKVNLYNSEMFLHSFAAAHVVGSIFLGRFFTRGQIQETFDFFSANVKRNIECNPWLTDFEKENNKHQCDIYFNSLKDRV